jgi:hypothetical protein
MYKFFPKCKREIFQSKQIINENEFIEYVNQVINTNDIKLIYSIVKSNHYMFLPFINQYNHIKVSCDLLDYFLKPNSLSIAFYQSGELVAFLTANKKDLCIRENNDIINKDDFFKSYKNLFFDIFAISKQINHTPFYYYILDIALKEYYIKHNELLYCGTYKINKKLSLPTISRHHLFFRPLKVKKLLDANIIKVTDINDISLLTKLYNTFSYPINFINVIQLQYFQNLKDWTQDEINSVVDILYEKLIVYNQQHCNIYNKIHKIDLKNTLDNNVFHKFIIRDNDNTILDFVCLYSTTNDNIIDGIMFQMFFNKSDTYSISHTLECVYEYCFFNNLFDIITLPNFLHIKQYQYRTFKLLLKNQTFYYYIYNIETPIIPPFKNGLF